MLKPIGSRVIIDQEIEKISSSLILDNLEDDLKLPRGVVVAIGENVCGVSVGDKVYFNELVGDRIKYKEEAWTDEKEYLVLKDFDIIAVYD